VSRILQRFAVQYEYPVYFTRQVFAGDNPTFAEALGASAGSPPRKFLAIVDDGVARAWPRLTADIEAYAASRRDRLELAGPPLVVPGGERCKNDASLVELVLRRLSELGIDRHSFAVLIGGGALLDAAGYAAATCHRGVRIVRVPTTVLAQDDSGVGVKNGINAFGKKNFLGTFAPPFAVINDASFLTTLETRDRVSGMAEAVKVALIRDAAFFTWIVEHAAALAAGEGEPLGELVRRSAELHLRHIATSGDPFELGSARPLDFGHWAAHKLETLSNNELRHGEAVAIGLALDSLYSASAGVCSSEVAERVVATLRALGFTLFHEALLREKAGRRAVLEGIDEFREHLGGELTVTLLADMGRGVEVHTLDEARILTCIEALRARA
jgi:3-dehydroquinate synthase